MLPKATGGRKLFAVAACKMHSMHLIPSVQVNLKFSAYSTSKSTNPLETSPGWRSCPLLTWYVERGLLLLALQGRSDHTGQLLACTPGEDEDALHRKEAALVLGDIFWEGGQVLPAVVLPQHLGLWEPAGRAARHADAPVLVALQRDARSRAAGCRKTENPGYCVDGAVPRDARSGGNNGVCLILYWQEGMSLNTGKCMFYLGP